MNIATALNRKYLRYTAVMLTSLCENNSWEHIDIYLLHNELKEEDLALLRETLQGYDASVVALPVDRSRFEDCLPRNEEWSIEMYYRLMLPELLPEAVDRILYLDVDMVILDSLRELYQTDFGEKLLVVTDDRNGAPFWESFTTRQRLMFRDLYEGDGRYFCSGMMLMNIEKLRREFCFARYMELADDWEYEMKAPDQDLLNYAHWNLTLFTDWRKYDFFAALGDNAGETYESVGKDTAILHFAGVKPWNGAAAHYGIEKHWWDYAEKTPFIGEFRKQFMDDYLLRSGLRQYVMALKRENEGMKADLSRSAELLEKAEKLLNKECEKKPI